MYRIDRGAWMALLFSSSSMLFSACSTAPSRSVPIEDRRQSTVPVTSPSVPARPSVTAPARPPTTQIFALPDTDVTPSAPLPVPATQNPEAAVITPNADPALRELLAQAERASARGDQGAARATLERALKIKPEDAQLWLRLAALNFDDGEFEQASVMAQRARSLAHGERGVLEQSDQLLARARQHLKQ